MPISPLSINTPPSRPAPGKIPWAIAAPSFVRSAGIAENCAFLEDKVDEVGLCFFETEACLAYDETDLPRSLAELHLNYHLHLPLDLDWADKNAAWAAVAALVEKTAFLSPGGYVLHPHQALTPREIAERFHALGISPSCIHLENIYGHPLTDIWDDIMESGLSVCLDMGHVLAYSQQPLLEVPGVWDRVRLLHLYAPDPAKPSRHAGLALLDQDGRKLLQDVLKHLDHDATVMLEVFDEAGLMTSINFFEACAGQR